MDVFIICVLLVIGLILIAKGGDYFVDGTSWLAEISGIPKFIIGANIIDLSIILSLSAFIAGGTGLHNAGNLPLVFYTQHNFGFVISG